MAETFDRTELESWTDSTAHAEWLAVRQQAKSTGFPMPERVRTDTVTRLHEIVCRHLGDSTATPDDDDLAIRAALALAKLATTTTTAVTAQATVLRNHAETLSPRNTSDSGLFLEELSRSFMNPSG